MAWFRKINNVSKRNGNVVCSITLSRDDADNETINLEIPGDDLSLEHVDQVCKDIIESRNARDESYDTLKALEGQTKEIV